MSISPDITISIISRNNLDQLRQCLESIFNSTEETNLQVYVVDNGSAEELAAAIGIDYPHVYFLRNEDKLGFSTNNNLVFSEARGRYVMILNDDTIILDQALDKLVSFMDENSEAAAVGASLFNEDGTPQPAYGSFPRPFFEAIWSVTNWYHYLSPNKLGPFEVDTICGAAMVVRRDVLDSVGALDTDFDPIYSEEVDWCYRIKVGAGKIFMHPEAKIVHLGSQTMDKVLPEKYELLLSHKHLFFKKHYGNRSAWIYKTTLLLSTFIKFLFWQIAALLFANTPRALSQATLHRHLLPRIRMFN